MIPGEIYVGDMREVLFAGPPNSIDASVTDPPYEIGIGGQAWDRSGVAYDLHTWAMLLRVLKPGAHAVVFGGPRSHHRAWCALEDAGFEIRDTITWLHAEGFSHTSDMKKVLEREGDATAEEIAAWAGYSSKLKAASEAICLVRKPLEGTIVENVRRWGTGVLDIDGCRTGTRPGDDPHDTCFDRELAGSTGDGHVDGMRKPRIYTPHGEGRWPPNVLLSHAEDCVEDGPCVLGCPVRELDEQSGLQRDGTAVRHRGSNFDHQGPWGSLGHKKSGTPDVTYGSSGGASRYYPRFRYVAKPHRNERDLGLTRRNPHMTVKPIALVRWLVRLVTPRAGICLDPFVGSGTTAIACELEGRRWIGVDADPASADVARLRALAGAELAGRVSADGARRMDVDRPVQIGIFGEGEGDG
jgi:DNA modification methylase